MQTTPAQRAERLDDFWTVLDPQPLQTPELLQAFYRDALNKVRANGTTERLALELTRRHGGTHFRCLLYGNQGCGKSTEVNKLLQQLQDRFRPVRVSVAQELNPSSFKVFDLLLLIFLRLVDEVKKLQNTQFLPSLAVPESLWENVVEYLEQGSAKSTDTKETKTSLQLSAFLIAKGEIQYASGRKDEVVNYRLQRLSFLADRVNALADAANRYLEDKHDRREWIIVVEDLDKQGVSSAAIRELLIDHSGLLESLRLHIILNVPSWMVWSADSTRLPFRPHYFQMPDVPVYESHHAPCHPGRAALREVLNARVNLNLFAEGQVDRLLVASGGNLRDLFAITNQAATLASIAGRSRIESADVTQSIYELRNKYETALGNNPFELNAISYEDKVQRLVDIHKQTPEVSSRHDSTLNALLKSGAVLRFNGEGRYGVHPLVVDLLKKYKKLDDNTSGGTI